tara:strand:- start:165 stop:581 length:417 start_codon:yes stop_codon:yes gene_type:complete
MKIFDWLNEITLHKKSWDSFSEEDHKSFNTFIINRFLSMNKDWIEIVNMLQQYTIGMESKDVYNLYVNMIPKGKRFLRYIKGKKDKKYNKELINILCNYFECSKLEVIQYMDLLSKEQIKNTLIMYGKNKKEIKTLLK